MGIAGRFAAPGNQTINNLAHLKADQIVGEWRDSTYGMFNCCHVGSSLCAHLWSAWLRVSTLWLWLCLS